MTKEKLGQIKYLKREIESTRKRIAELHPEIVSDTVMGSSRHFPFTEHPISVTGLEDQGRINRKRMRLETYLKRRLETLIELQQEIEEFISTIDDSRTRQIITYRYINGLEWSQVAARIGGGNTPDGVRVQHDRFLKNT